MRLIALLAAAVCAVAAGDIDPCKRQPFRGRCPSQNGATPSRSQFVLRYYMRDGECVSYPYGHCANDDSEPKLFRYKEECEDACIRGPGNLGSPKQTTKGQEAPVTTTLKAIEPTTVATEATTEKIETTEAVTKAQTTTQRPTTTAAPTTQAPTTLAPRTECERRRAFSGGLIKGGFIPTCTPNGEFEKMQCEPNGGQCFCVDNKGIEMPNSRMNGKPNCAGILSASVAVSSECTGAATPGPCSSNIDRWYYDESAQKCKSFKYSGCGGNGNNYPTEAGCNSRCAPPPQGAMRCEKGEPLKTLSGAPINCAKRECPSGYDCSVVQGSSVCCPQNEKTVGALETPINDVCAIPKERGPCDKYELRFYYNAEMKECKYFFWGGCDGNGNNFEKLEDCEAKCHVAKPSRNGGHVTQPLNPTQPQSTTVTRPTTTTQRPTTRAAPTTTPVHMPSHSVRPPAAAIPLGTVNIPDHSAIEAANNVCIHDVDAGECNGVFQRFAFDQESGECRPFTYGGCGGNGNNFASFAECENKCHGAKVVVTTTQAPVPPPVNICAHPVDKGPCNGLFSRFFFDGSVNECRQFTYGGCGGNGNNFASSSDCRRACQKALPVPQQNTNTQRPVQIPQRGSILPIPEARPACPLIDLEACVEPCIVFSNRKGCKECVCPVMENQPQPPRAAAPLSENNVARPPAPRAPQPPSPPSAPAFTPAPVVAQPPAPRRPVEQVPVPRAPETFQRPMQTFERPIETTARPVETFRRPVETVPTLELSHNKLQTPEQDKPVAPSPPAPSAPAPRQFVPQTVQQPLAPLNPSHVPSQLTEKCMQPVDAGPCNHFVDRWFFNVEDGACHPFKYGGCAGNRNHFFTQKECEIHCARFSQDYNTDDSIKKTQPTAVPTTQSTTTTQASTTTVKETTATVTFTTPVPVQPDGAGREPVPSVPVGIGRKAVELTLDDLDTPTETPSTSVPSTRATFAPKPEVFGPPHGAAQNNVHQLREEPFNAQIVCTQSPDAGRCTNYVPRWFFNVQTGQCEQFSYGSCGGNANNFMDRATCEVRCLSLHRPVNVLSRVPERCSLEKDSGFGRGYFAKWYFNMKNLRCEQFVYEGQRGNENQFDTLTDCERYCTPQPGTFFTKPAPTTTQKPPVQPVKQVEQEPIVKKDEIVPESPKVSLAPIAPTLAPQTTIVLDSDESTEPGIDKDEDEEEEDNFNSLSPIPSVAKSFEEKPIEQIQPQAPSSNQIPLASLENISPPATEPRPPAHAAKTEQVAAPQPIPNISGQNDPEPNKSYKAEPLPTGPAVDAHEGLPRVAPSPKETVNYQTGQHAQAKGLRTFGDDLQPIDIDSDNEFPDEEPEIKPLMPACPNGIQEMRYADGRPVMCLPGRNQCPDKSVCFFNGIDYFCCPNEEDPYDKHVFGGYEGEETRNGYKTFGPLRIQKLRHKRQASFNLDQIVMPLRFDAEKPKQFARAGAVMSSNRRRKQPSSTQAKEVLDAASANIAVCVQELAKGDCSEAHLRYFYDRDSDSCRLFYYSGCKGNGNNFGSLDDCQKTCVLGMKQTTMQQVQQTQQVKSIIPIENVPVGQCPGGMTPLGGPAPVLCGNNTDSIGCPSGYYCRAGPPDVCCPGQDPTKLSLAALISKDVRFAPQTGSSESTESSAEVATTTTVAPHKSFLDVPRFICPDASDPLLGKNGKPLMCGAGFDGMKMCPRGYYCAIDSEKGTRLCCALLAIGSRVPNEQVNAPYFGRRPANPGEVVERGSLPADQEDAKAHKHEDHAKPEFNTDEGSVEVTNDSVATSAQAEETTPEAEEEATTDDETVEESTESSNEEEEEEELPKLKMKPENPHAKLQEEAASVDPRVTKTEADEGVSMTVEDPKMPTVEEATPVKETMDRSICHLTPSEGRVCRDDERAPRTNLHYFYSAKDKRCKLYFYRGCGGNANRFEKKAACEAMCLNQA